MSNTRLIGRIRNHPEPSTPVLVLSKLLLCVVPIAQIAIGAVYLHECPRQHYIPIYLMVMGAVSLSVTLLSCLPCTREPKDGSSNPLSRVFMAWNSLTTIFICCWFIAGNVWIYSIYKPNFDKNTTNVDPYCDRTLYLFAFWTTTLFYILMGIFLLGGCCALVIFSLCGRASDDL